MAFRTVIVIFPGSGAVVGVGDSGAGTVGIGIQELNTNKQTSKIAAMIVHKGLAEPAPDRIKSKPPAETIFYYGRYFLLKQVDGCHINSVPDPLTVISSPGLAKVA